MVALLHDDQVKGLLPGLGRDIAHHPNRLFSLLHEAADALHQVLFVCTELQVQQLDAYSQCGQLLAEFNEVGS